MVITLNQSDSDKMWDTLFISSRIRLSFLTFKILQASSRSMPSCFVRRFEPDMPAVAAFDPPFAAVAALFAAA
jgi:hypothetical protein